MLVHVCHQPNGTRLPLHRCPTPAPSPPILLPLLSKAGVSTVGAWFTPLGIWLSGRARGASWAGVCRHHAGTAAYWVTRNHRSERAQKAEEYRQPHPK